MRQNHLVNEDLVPVDMAEYLVNADLVPVDVAEYHVNADLFQWIRQNTLTV